MPEGDFLITNCTRCGSHLATPIKERQNVLVTVNGKEGEFKEEEIKPGDVLGISWTKNGKDAKVIQKVYPVVHAPAPGNKLVAQIMLKIIEEPIATEVAQEGEIIK